MKNRIKSREAQIKIISTKEFEDMVNDLGPKVQFVQIEVNKGTGFTGIKDIHDHFIYVAACSAEWFFNLSNGT